MAVAVKLGHNLFEKEKQISELIQQNQELRSTVEALRLGIVTLEIEKKRLVCESSAA